MHYYQLIVFFLILLSADGSVRAQAWKSEFPTPFEESDGWETSDYESAIRYYRRLAHASNHVSLHEMGKTDSGHPLHLVLLSGDGDFDLETVSRDNRSVMLVNNAIHPGESDGVDASMAFARDLAFDRVRYSLMLEQVIVAIIPLYNIGGALNRNSGTRANQNGPREYGFRGNGRNYDLNRDFIKCDTLNARSFARIFHTLDPDLFIDTHVSNGADYQHVMTTSQSQKDKLGMELGSYLHETFEPRLFAGMRQAGFPTVPYVNSGGGPPEQGYAQFLETPRYSTGYTGLFQTMGYMTETHMLKPYPTRVAATRTFLDQALALLSEQGATLQQIRQNDRDNYPKRARVPISWEVDTTRPSQLEFQGYRSTYTNSKVTPGQRLFYDRQQPFTRDIPFYNNYTVSKSVALPAGYLIPREWHSVIELMQLNSVELGTLAEPTQLEAEVYRIEEVETRSTPYEGHYFHDTLTLSKTTEKYSARKGDVIIPIEQDRARYVVESLEPAAMDSLFRWNRFDTILQRKEYFSPYVFEGSAEAMLVEDAKLKQEFELRKAQDDSFAQDRKAQLTFLYERSKHYEKSHRRYPVLRLLALPSK